jgi:hypothetical protein
MNETRTGDIGMCFVSPGATDCKRVVPKNRKILPARIRDRHDDSAQNGSERDLRPEPNKGFPGLSRNTESTNPPAGHRRVDPIPATRERMKDEGWGAKRGRNEFASSQSKSVDWAPVFDRIAAELRRKVSDTVPKPSVVIETAGEQIDATAETRLHPRSLMGWTVPGPGHYNRVGIKPGREAGVFVRWRGESSWDAPHFRKTMLGARSVFRSRGPCQ